MEAMIINVRETHDYNLEFLLHFCKLFKDYLFFPLFGICYGIYLGNLKNVDFSFKKYEMKFSFTCCAADPNWCFKVSFSFLTPLNSSLNLVFSA